MPEEALERLDGLLAGWRYLPDNPGRYKAARVLATLEEVEQRELSAFVSRTPSSPSVWRRPTSTRSTARPDRASKVETVVIGTVLGDALFAALRRVAQEHVTSVRYGSPSASAEP